MEMFKNRIKIITTKIIQSIRTKLKLIPKPLVGVIFSAFILLCPLLNGKIAWGHDYSFHSSNMILASDTLNVARLRIILPKIFGGIIAKGFGYGTGIFYPPLSYSLTAYISYFLKLINLDTNLSITILEIIVTILSGIIMYIFLKRIFKDNKIASIGSISYISSTYFLCNIYIRSALGELLTFIFIPLVFWGLYELFFEDGKKFNLLFIVGYVGMIHSHLVLTMYLTIIIILTFLCFPKKVFKKDKIQKLLISSSLILLISSTYLVPLIEHKLLGNYVVFEPYSMYSDNWIKENSLTLRDYLTIGTKANNIKVYINQVSLCLFIIVSIFNKKIFTKEKKHIYLITMIIIVISTIMSSSYFPWENVPSFFKMIQFPWRLCVITTFGISIIVGNIVKIIKGENKTLIIVGLTLAMLLFGYNTIRQETVTNPTAPLTMNMGSQSEYLPSNTLNNIEYFNRRNQDVFLKEGSAEVYVNVNNPPYLKATINLTSNTTIIELPRLYYLGYKVQLIDCNGNIEKINYYENKYGFIELQIDKSGTLELSYEGTLANKVSNYICMITITSYILYAIYTKRYIKENR